LLLAVYKKEFREFGGYLTNGSMVCDGNWSDLCDASLHLNNVHLQFVSFLYCLFSDKFEQGGALHSGYWILRR